MELLPVSTVGICQCLRTGSIKMQVPDSEVWRVREILVTYRWPWPMVGVQRCHARGFWRYHARGQAAEGFYTR